MKFLILFMPLCGLTLGLSRVDPLVSTKRGLIRGLRDSKGYAKFLGVPYGKIDGNNVFGAAVPHPDFDDIFEAYDDSKTCVQVGISSDDVTGTIDCLNINIYVPDAASSNNRLPVMVWIHGGGFIEGSAVESSADPYVLLRHDVIVVAINYRLGVFGFMCLDIPEVPGNTGLKDQVLALRWIKENIEAFSGDPNQITVFGESAGGMSVNFHMFSSSEKLFHRAIIQSGTANSPWINFDSDNTLPIRIAEELGFNTSDIQEALSFLANIDPHAVTRAEYNIKINYFNSSVDPLTAPCIEQEFEGVDALITEHPNNLKLNKAGTIPVLIGYNSIEFAFFIDDDDYLDTFDISQYLEEGFNFNNEFLEPADFMKHFYIGDKEVSKNVKWEIVDFLSDFIFNHPTERMAQKLLEEGTKNVYKYVFSYNGNNSWNKSWTGATHVEELVYLFDLKMDGGEKSEEDQLVTDRLTELWTNFAKFGDPTPVTSDLLPVKWAPITRTTHPYLEIDSELTLKNRPFHERMAFWDLFYKQYGKFQKWYKA